MERYRNYTVTRTCGVQITCDATGKVLRLVGAEAEDFEARFLERDTPKRQALFVHLFFGSRDAEYVMLPHTTARQGDVSATIAG